MKGKTCLVTGATNGIGLAAARALAAMGATVIVHGRNAEKGKRTVDQIVRKTKSAAVRFVQADFASLADVRRLAGELNQTVPRLDVLLNNAGLLRSKRTVTKDGFETTFAVNHLAPFLLTNLLLDKLKGSTPARIVNVASGAHRIGKLDFADLMGEKKFRAMRAYGTSKLANILFTCALDKRLQGTGVTANSLHPGVVRTGFGQDGGLTNKIIMGVIGPLLKTPEQGAETCVFLASSPAVEGRSGGYYDNCKPAKPTADAMDDAAAERLWQESARLVGLAG